MPPRFLQIHTLTSYPASLLNRDDVGFAKRIPFGAVERTRISSQCLKRHWRRAEGENALAGIRVGDTAVEMSIRSRRTFEKYLYDPLVAEGIDPRIARAVSQTLLETVLPEGKGRKAERERDKKRQPEEAKEPKGDEDSLRTEQVTVIGHPEMVYLQGLARQAAAGATDSKKAVKAFDKINTRELKSNLEALSRGAGLDAAVFGRMTTGDILSRCDAAIHVAHALTVHAGQFETDYFSAVDDLQEREETGSGHINTSEIGSGLFYGYAVVDLPLLVSNLEGCERRAWQAADRTLASEVVRCLIHLIATVSPGAKLGATAPYAHASMVLIEAGNRQPRTLANAFLDAVPTRGDLLANTYERLARYLVEHDAMYGREADRRVAVLGPAEVLMLHAERLDLPSLATWAAESVRATA